MKSRRNFVKTGPSQYDTSSSSCLLSKHRVHIIKNSNQISLAVDALDRQCVHRNATWAFGCAFKINHWRHSSDMQIAMSINYKWQPNELYCLEDAQELYHPQRLELIKPPALRSVVPHHNARRSRAGSITTKQALQNETKVASAVEMVKSGHSFSYKTVEKHRHSFSHKTVEKAQPVEGREDCLSWLGQSYLPSNSAIHIKSLPIFKNTKASTKQNLEIRMSEGIS
jgi:hypothetical protein